MFSQILALLVCAMLVFSTSASYAIAQSEPAPEEQLEVIEEPEPLPEEEPEAQEEEIAEEETEPAEEPPETIIETGDAVAGGDITNETNTNVTDTDGDDDDDGGVEIEDADAEEESTEDTPFDDETADAGEGVSESQPSTEESGDENTDEGSVEDDDDLENSEETSEEDTTDESATGGGGDALNVTDDDDGDDDESDADQVIDNENDALLENSADIIAETDENKAEGEGDVIIDTGNALAYANVVNLANTNIVNSTGFLLFFSQLFGTTSFDMRDMFSVFEDTESAFECSFYWCEQDTSMNVTNDNDAVIVNNVTVTSSTGENSAISSDGSASITTGDAYASANVINIANTNITDSGYLVVSFNNFGSLFGDIVLPGKDFFESLFSAVTNGFDSLTATNTNDADIANNVDTTAETGDNSAESSDGDATIETGDATAMTSVYNQANTNLIGADSFVILFRIHGNWDGEIFGLPDNILWTETDEGIMLLNNTGNSSGNASGDIEVTNTNNASITNNVSVMALTGDNKVEGGDGASIVTGDAHAASNIVNIVNTNVLGQNWALLIFNIFGDWAGDLSFGRPDLWIGGSASSNDNPINRGSTVTYTFTIANNGDTDATDVVLASEFGNILTPQGSSTFSAQSEGNGSLNVGTVPAGEVVEISYDVRVGDNLPGGDTAIVTEATVTSHETDENMEDNSESITIVAVRRGGGSRIYSTKQENIPSRTRSSDLVVSKSVSTTTVADGGIVNYTLTITNEGGSAYHAQLRDTLVAENETVVADEIWDLGEIVSDEQITVTYDVEFDEGTAPGTYTNYAQVRALDTYDSLEMGNEIESNIASAVIIVLDDEGEVLGEELCTEYITTYLRLGTSNEPEDVTRLQNFLIEYEGYTLEPTGIFDATTDRIVKMFQERYGDDVLLPWGITQGTGYVYYTTRKKINELYCDNVEDFGLTDAQLKEMQGSNTNVQTDPSGEPDLSEEIPQAQEVFPPVVHRPPAPRPIVPEVEQNKESIFKRGFNTIFSFFKRAFAEQVQGFFQK